MSNEPKVDLAGVDDLIERCGEQHGMCLVGDDCGNLHTMWEAETALIELRARIAALEAKLAKKDAQLAEARAENERLREALSALSSYLGAGIGDDATTAEQLIERIRWGIEHNTRVQWKICADIVEECSRRPSTTWGEVKKAILARAALAGDSNDQ